MLKIRMQRIGRRHEPHFRILVTDARRGPKSGKFIEILGSYNAKMGEIKLNADRIKYWIGVGAQVSDTVWNFLVKEKIVDGPTRNALPKKTPIIKEVEEEAPPATPEASQDEKENKEEKEETPTEEEVKEEATEEKEEKKEDTPKEEEKVEEKKEEKKEEPASTEEAEETPKVEEKTEEVEEDPATPEASQDEDKTEEPKEDSKK